MYREQFPKIVNGIEHILNPPEASFASWDWVVLVAYFATIVIIGFAFSYQRKRANKSDSSEEYFKGSGQIPGWVAGMSIWATTLSAITYMATPANAFVGSWMYAFGNITIFIFAPFLIIYIVPFFRHINATTAYEYLEKRFSYIVRALGSIMFVCYHIFRIAIVIYLPTLAFSAIIDINPLYIAAFIGIISLVYTVVAGIKGVVWTEAIQGFVLLAGIIIIIGFLIGGIINNGTTWSEFLKSALANDKFMGGADGKSAWKLTIVGASIPIIFLGQLINTAYQYVGSQDVVQRYQTSKSSKEVNKGIWINAFLATVGIFLFYGAGTLLWGYYDTSNYLYLFGQSDFFSNLNNGNNIIGNLEDGARIDENTALGSFINDNVFFPGAGQATDNVLPFYVLSALPVAVTGLIIAALFAACQSTIASSLNAVATCLTVDFIYYQKKDLDEKKIVKISQVVMILFGLFATFVCLMMLVSGVYDLLNFFIGIIGGFGAPVFGMFFLGMFTTRANKQGTLIGGAIGSIVGIVCFFVSSTMIMNDPLISSLWTPIFAFFTVVIIGYFLSIILDFGDKKGYWTLSKNKDKTNLTVWSWTKDTKDLIKEEKALNKDESKYNRNCKKIKWQNRYIKLQNKFNSKKQNEIKEFIVIPEKTYLDKYEDYFKEMTLIAEQRKQEKVDELKAWKEAKQK